MTPAPLYNRDFAIVFICQVCFVLGNVLLLTHYARWITFLGGDEWDIGSIMGTGSIVGLFLRPWMGDWIDRLGARATQVIASAMLLVSAPANLLVDDLSPALYLFRTLAVLAAALFFASSITYITQVAPLHRRTEAIGMLGAGGFIGMIIGPIAGDVVLGSTGRVRADFVHYFWVTAIPVLIGLVLLLLLRRPVRPAPASAFRLRDFAANVRDYWPGPIVLVTTVFGVCMAVPFFFLSSYVDAIGTGGVGRFFLAYGTIGLVLRLWLRQLPDRIGRSKVLVMGLALYSIGVATFLLVTRGHANWLLVPALICGAGHSLIFHPMIALAVDPFPDDKRGTGSALALMALDMGTIGGAPILGRIAKNPQMGYPTMFLTVSGTCLMAAAYFAWASRRKAIQLAAATYGAVPLAADNPEA